MYHWSLKLPVQFLATDATNMTRLAAFECSTMPVGAGKRINSVVAWRDRSASSPSGVVFVLHNQLLHLSGRPRRRDFWRWHRDEPLKYRIRASPATAGHTPPAHHDQEQAAAPPKARNRGLVRCMCGRSTEADPALWSSNKSHRRPIQAHSVHHRRNCMGGGVRLPPSGEGGYFRTSPWFDSE